MAEISRDLEVLGVQYLALSENVCQTLKNLRFALRVLQVNIDFGIHLGSVMKHLAFLVRELDGLEIQLVSRNLTDSTLKHLFVQEFYLNQETFADLLPRLRVRVGDYDMSAVVQESLIEEPHEDFKMLELPFASDLLLQGGENSLVQEDLKKLLQSEKFLEITHLDLSPFQVDSEIVELLLQSEHVRNLQILDLSRSLVANQDLEQLGRSARGKLGSLQSVMLNECPHVSSHGVNHLQEIEVVSLRGVRLVLDTLLPRTRGQLLLNELSVLAEKEYEVITQLFPRVVIPVIDQLEILEIEFLSTILLQKFAENLTEKNQIRSLTLKNLLGQ